MKIIRKRELIIERERRVTIKSRPASGERFCRSCNETRQFVTIDEATLIRQTTARNIFRLLEADRIHYVETEAGLLLVCLASLSELAGESLLLPPRGEA